MTPATIPAFRSIASAMIGAAFFLSVGGHLAILQGIAWTNMVRDFAKLDPLGTAIEKTLSGQHPCSLCEEITKAVGSPHENTDSLIQKVKLGEFIDLRTVTAIMTFARPFTYPPSQASQPEALSYPPPVPVPIPERA